MLLSAHVNEIEHGIQLKYMLDKDMSVIKIELYGTTARTHNDIVFITPVNVYKYLFLSMNTCF